LAWQGRIISRREFEVEPTSAGATALALGVAMNAAASFDQGRDQNCQYQAFPSAFSPLEIIQVHGFVGLASSSTGRYGREIGGGAHSLAHG
jgi:hypothetical protein